MKERIKFRSTAIACTVAALLLALSPETGAQEVPIISSFSQNGELTCINLEPGTPAVVEWASSVNGPWTNNWSGLDAVNVDSNGQIRVSVPMFYRVRGIAQGTVPTNMAFIPGGSFTMGDCMDPADGFSNELPLHTVHVSAFYMDKHLVTKALWDAIKAWNGGNGYSYSNIGSGKAADHPVQTITWFDAVKWCNARSEQEGLVPCYYTDEGLTTLYKTGQVVPYVNWAANGYRLPTEAEWEKAARGGASGHRFPWTDTDTITHSRANYFSYAGLAYDISPTRDEHPTFGTGEFPHTSPVGYFPANGYGLYDMAGNVLEWCWDWYASGWYSNAGATQNDTRGPASGTTRSVRGGLFGETAFYSRCAYRFGQTPSGADWYTGFRCVRGL
jgi:formylglycine-generating enzyme